MKTVMKKIARRFLIPLYRRLIRHTADRLPRPADRGAPPKAGIGCLQQEYRARDLDKEPDTFVLYRIIGNDLVPRHKRGQSRENLRFILEHEPELPYCEKRWVVNRIVDPEEEAAILQMLDERGQKYIHIPFELDEYAAVPWDLDGLPYAGFSYSNAFDELPEDAQGRLKMRLYRHKNNYVMHNNGARNAALREGRTIAKWVLPWDGNCFVTARAWSEIMEKVTAEPWYKYFVVPMARITDNSKLLDPGFRPEPLDEPQILFRRDAAEEFDEAHPYGRRPKVQLFWRLGVPGKWDQWCIEPWDLPYPPFVEEAGQFAWAGWVARLFSGQTHLEHSRKAGLVKRGLARVEAVTGLLDHLDTLVVARQLVPAKLTMYVDQGPTAQCSNVVGLSGSALVGIVNRLTEAAEDALGRGPYSVVDKLTLPPSGDPHDYWHPAPYYWPVPLAPRLFPYVRRDGKRVPGTRLYEPESDRYDRTRLQRLFDDTTILALAWYYTGDERYAEHGAQLVRHWFLEPESRMNPHLKYAQVRMGHNRNLGSKSGIIEMKDLYYFLDAVRLLTRSGALDAQETQAFKRWLSEYLEWLCTSEQGRGERRSRNNHGTYYDLQVVSIAAYLGEYRLLLDTLRTSRERILQQFEPDGRQPEELKRTVTAHYCCFNLQGWVHLATLAAACGEDLWHFEGADGRGIRRGLEWLLSHMGSPWPYKQIDTFDAERFLPLYHYYLYVYGVPSFDIPGEIPELHQIKPLFYPHDGIRPFWMLGFGSGFRAK